MKKLTQIHSIALLSLFFCSIQFGVAQNKVPTDHIIFHVIKQPACPPYPLTFNLEIDINAVNLHDAQFENYEPFRIAIFAIYANKYVGYSDVIEVSPEGWSLVGNMDCNGQLNNHYQKSFIIPLDFSSISCQKGQLYVPYQQLVVKLVGADFDPNDLFPESYDDTDCIQAIFPFSCFNHPVTSTTLGNFDVCHACNIENTPLPDHDISTNLANSNTPDHLSNGINTAQKLGTGESASFSSSYAMDMQDNTSIYPNPFKNELFINYSSDHRQDIQLKITDINGRTVQTIKQLTEKGINQFSLDTTDLPNGIYFLTITNGSHTYSRKIIK